VILDTRQKLFVVLTATFAACLLIGDLIGGKLISGTLFGIGFTTTVGMIPFPVTFLLTDLINEFYGKRAARFVTFLALSMALLAYAFVYVAAQIPIAEMARDPAWTGVREGCFQNVFIGSLRMLAASLVAYLISQLTDIAVFGALKRWSGPRLLWLRATGSTAISQLIDTVAITLVAWSGMMPLTEMLRIMVSAYTLKIVIAVGLTPLVYAGHRFVEGRLGIAPAARDGDAIG
jgi:queuosine precursor transporter